MATLRSCDICGDTIGFNEDQDDWAFVVDRQNDEAWDACSEDCATQAVARIYQHNRRAKEIGDAVYNKWEIDRANDMFHDPAEADRVLEERYDKAFSEAFDDES